jgi:hypothetical protein
MPKRKAKMTTGISTLIASVASLPQVADRRI